MRYVAYGSNLHPVRLTSFDYDLPDADKMDRKKLEHYPYEVVVAARRLFEGLQDQQGWFDLEGTTKTAFAYQGF